MSVRGVGQQSESGLLSGFSSGNLVAIVPDVNRALADSHAGTPCRGATREGLQMDTPVLGCLTAMTTGVLPVARFCDRPQITTAIVQTVAVDVVTFSLVVSPQPKQHAMQPYGRIMTLDSSTTTRVTFRAKSPRKAPHIWRIVGVNYGVSQNGALAVYEWDKGNRAFQQDERRGRRVRTSRRTEPAPYSGRCSLESRAARRTGKMYGHRLAPTGGVAPQDVCASLGYSCCVNYTSPPQVEVA